MAVSLVNVETNAVEQVPEAEVVDALRSGKYGMQEGQKVPVVFGGNVVQATAEDLGKVFEQKGRLALPEEVRDAQLEAEAETPGGQLKTVGESLLQVPTIGFGKGLLTDVGISDPEAMAARERANPVESILPEVVGTLGSLAVPGAGEASAASTLGRLGSLGLRGATASPRLLARLGAGAERVVAEGLGGGLVARTLGGAAGAGVEGLGYGVGNAYTEERLHGGDPDKFAEHMLAGAGETAGISALLGAAVPLAGGVLGAAGRAGKRAWSRVGASDLERTAAAGLGHEVPAGFGSRLKEEYLPTASTMAGPRGPEAMRTFVSGGTSESRQAARRAATDVSEFDRVRETVLHDVNEMLESGTPVYNANWQRGTQKLQNMERLVADTVETRHAAEATHNYLRGEIRAMADNVDEFGSPDMLRRMMDSTEQRSEAVIGKGAGHQYVSIDSAKHDFQQWKGMLDDAAVKEADPFRKTQYIRSADRVGKISESLRTNLEDASVWGSRAATAQKEINEANVRFLQTKQIFERSLTRELPGTPESAAIWGVNKRVADPDRATGFLQNVTNPRKDLVVQEVKKHIQARRDLANAIEKHYWLSGDQTKELGRMNAATERMDKSLDEATRVVSLQNLLKEQLRSESSGALSPLMGAAGGLHFGGPLGGLVGLATAGVMNPGRTTLLLTAMDKLKNKVKPALEGAARAAIGIGRRTRPVTAYVRAKISSPAWDEQHRERMAAIEDLTRDAANAGEMLGPQLEPIAGASPAIAAAVTAKAIQIAHYLRQVAPKMTPENPLLPGSPPRPLALSVREAFERQFRGATAPVQALDAEANQGLFTEETVAAVQANWPQVFEEFKQHLIEQITESGKSPSYQDQIMLETRLKVPFGNLDVTYTQAVQSGYAASAEPQAAPSQGINTDAPSKLGKELKTEAQSLAEPPGGS